MHYIFAVFFVKLNQVWQIKNPLYFSARPAKPSTPFSRFYKVFGSKKLVILHHVHYKT